MTTPTAAQPLIALPVLVLDTETTGLDTAKDRIIQIGALAIDAGKLDSARPFEALVNPGIPIPPASTAIHGLKDGDVADAPVFPTVADELEQLWRGRVIVGHTIGFDLAMLEREWLLAGRQWQPPQTLDVRMLARVANPGLAFEDLDRLCAWQGIEITGRHTALGDAQATAALYLSLLPLLRQRGIRTYAEAWAASRAQAEQAARAAGAMAATSPADQRGPLAVLARIDSFPYRHRVRDVMSSPAIFASGDTSAVDALGVLIDNGISSVFVRDAKGEVGIVTERDLIRVIRSEGAEGLEARLSSIMKAPLQSVLEDDFVYRAIGRIERLGFRHLAVRNAKGEITGALTTRNLLRHRATTAIALGDEIDAAPDVPALAAAWGKLVTMARSLVDEDVDARAVSQVISTEICAITARAAQLSEAKLAQTGRGEPPTAYAVLVLGSAGRGESLLAADQDNAIVFAEGEPGGHADQWFESLGREMNDILDAVGIPLCKGGVMARNAPWRRSLADWRAQVDRWITHQRPEDLLNVDIFFDNVCVHGDSHLADELAAYTLDRASKAPAFVMLLTELARQWRSPISVFGRIRTGEDGRIDLKRHGLLPLVTGARALSIRHHLRARSTPDRLRGLLEKGICGESDIIRLIGAHQAVLDAMLRQQIVDAEAGIPLTPTVAISSISAGRRARLKAALTDVGTISSIVGEGRL